MTVRENPEGKIPEAHAGGTGDSGDCPDAPTIMVELQVAGKPLEGRLMGCGAAGVTIMELVKELELHPGMIISVKEGKPVPMTENVNPGETVRLINVVSGG